MPTLGPLVVMRFLAGAGAARRHPAGDRLDRRRRPLRAPPADPGALPLGPDPGHRLRPGGRRPARRPDRLARRPWWCWASRMSRPACCCSSRCAAGRDVRPRRRPHPLGRSAGAGHRDACSGRWVRVVLVTMFLEGVAMFGAFAYVGAELHQRFGLGLGMIGAMLASFGVGALVYSLAAGMLVARLGQPGLAACGRVAAGHRLCHARGLTPWLWLAPPAIAARRPRLLHAAQHAADQRHADGARVARARRLAVRVRAVHAASRSALRWPRR